MNGAVVPFESHLDARKKYSSDPQVPHISSMALGIPLAINTLPDLTYRVQIPIEVLVNVSGNYTLELAHIREFESSACVGT